MKKKVSAPGILPCFAIYSLGVLAWTLLAAAAVRGQTPDVWNSNAGNQASAVNGNYATGPWSGLTPPNATSAVQINSVIAGSGNQTVFVNAPATAYSLSLSESAPGITNQLQLNASLNVTTTITLSAGNGGSAVISGTALSINAGNTLRGNGTVNSATTVNADGTLSAGTAASVPATFRFGTSLTLAGAAVFDAAASGGVAFKGINYDFVNVIGALTYGGALTLNLNGTTPALGSQYDLFDFASQTGAFSSITLTGDASNFYPSFDYATGILTLTNVPEPSTWALFMVGGILSHGAVRRRRAA